MLRIGVTRRSPLGHGFREDRLGLDEVAKATQAPCSFFTHDAPKTAA
jgi:hypothetical protein